MNETLEYPLKELEFEMNQDVKNKDMLELVEMVEDLMNQLRSEK